MLTFRALMLALTIIMMSVLLSGCLDKATQARIGIEAFNATCPAQMQSEFVKDVGFAKLDAGVVGTFARDTCNCVVGKLNTLPPEQTLAILQENELTPEVEAFATPCVAKAIKQHVGAVCMSSDASGNVDPATMRRFCGCMQRNANNMPDEQIANAIMKNDQKSIERLADGCDVQ